MTHAAVMFGNIARFGVVLAALIETSPALASRLQYRLVDLGTLGNNHTYALEVTSSGRVAGYAQGGGAFFWSRETGMIEVHPTGIGQPQVSAMSDTSRIVGNVVGEGGHLRGFSWTRQDGAVDIGTLRGECNRTEVTGTNNGGQVVGGSCDRAFVWTARDGMRDLGTLGGASAFAEAVSNTGQVVGWSADVAGWGRAFSWTERGGMVDLGTFGTASAVSDTGFVALSGPRPDLGTAMHTFLWTARDGLTWVSPGVPIAVNNGGSVIGHYRGYPFFWSPTSGRISLGTSFTTVASALSDAGLVVGQSFSHLAGETHAFVWSVDTGMIELGSLAGGFSAARAINRRGEIVGYSSDANGIVHAVLWEPVAAPLWEAVAAAD